MIKHICIAYQGEIDFLYGEPITDIEGLAYDQWNWKKIVTQLDPSRNLFVMKRHIGGIKSKSSVITVWDPSEIIFSRYHENDISNVINDIPLKLKNILSDLPNINAIELEKYIGYYGFLGFEFSRYVEKYDHREDQGLLPDLFFVLPTKYFIDDGEKQIYIELEGKVQKYRHEIRNVDQLTGFQFQMPISHYISSLESILRYIKSGDIYQTNFTHQFMFTTDKDPITSYLKLIEKNLVEQHALISNSQFSILSISPELFIHSLSGVITTRPIKGTIKRGQTEEEDELNKQSLLNSEKDKAELTMIVDLLRNDLGRSVKSGSVTVETHAELESFSNVHHLVSTIKGKISADVSSSWKLLLRAFPGGSISGVPKIRALELLEKHETTPRGVYTGSIGCLTISGDMEFNIAIRTLTQIQNHVYCNAGGGIVVDSDPWLEFIETIHKAKHLVSYFGYDIMEQIVWLNGEFLSRHKLDTTFTKSHGFFETIRVENSIIKGFERHWERILLGFEYYNLVEIQTQDNKYSFDEFREYLKSIIQKFALLSLHPISRLKISFYVKGPSVDIFIEIFEYNIPENPIKLLMTDKEFTPVEEVSAGIKPLNYANYRINSQYANENGYWDMLLHREGTVLETGKASILYSIDNEWFVTHGNVLNGTIRKALMSNNIVERELRLDELHIVDQLFVCNAMIEVLPVETIILDTKQVWKSIPKYEMVEHFKKCL